MQIYAPDIFEFSHYFTENIENLESVENTAELNFKMCFIGNIQGFHNKDNLRLFQRCL